jgi:uncharacterized membrane protein
MAIKNKLKNFFNFSPIVKDLQKEECIKTFEKTDLFTLSKEKLFLGLLFFLAIINTLVSFNLELFYIRATLTFLFLILVPGILIIFAMKIHKLKFWEYLIYTIGLSISFVIFAGLIINWILPLLHITEKPLSIFPILICFNIFLIGFGIIAWKRNKDFKPFKITIPKLDIINRIFFIVPLFFPMFAILGAFLLNNHGTNILTMVMLGGTAIYVLLLTIFRKHLNENIYPWALWIIGLSMLISVSLRGWQVFGHDVMREQVFFLLTNKLEIWNIMNPKNAYNTCASITLLPVIFSKFLAISDQNIFKLFSQIIFSIMPIGVYIFFKKYCNNICAFLSGFFFVALPSFFMEMPMQVRQEYALLFFTLSLLVLFNKKLSTPTKKILFILFTFSMILSHYSTSYISIILFMSSLSLILFHKKLIKRKKLQNKQNFITILLVILILTFAFLWYFQITETSEGGIRFAKNGFENIKNIFSEDTMARGISNTLWSISKEKENIYLILQEYSHLRTKEYHEFSNSQDFYDKEKYELYKIKLVIDKNLKPTSIGKIISSIGINLYKINYYLRQISSKIIQLFMALGIISILLCRKFRQKLNINYIAILISCLLLLAAIVVFPYATIDYSLSRVYQQVFIILSFLPIIGAFFFLKFFNKDKIIIFMSILFIAFYLLFSGFIPQFLGGYPPQPNLNNKGIYYDVFQPHESEILSSNWLYNQKKVGTNLYADEFSKRKILTLSKNSLIIETLLPSTINKDSYVYLDYTNTLFKKSHIHSRGGIIGYETPINFLNTNKNCIYFNGESKIYR